MSEQNAQGCLKHFQPVQLGRQWYYIMKLYMQDGELWASLGPYGIGHVRGFGYTRVPVTQLG